MSRFGRWDKGAFSSVCIQFGFCYFIYLFIYISLETLMLGHVKVHMFLKEDILLFSHIVCLSASHLSSTAWMYSTIWILHHILIKCFFIFNLVFDTVRFVVLEWRMVDFHLLLCQKASEVRSWRSFLLPSIRKQKTICLCPVVIYVEHVKSLWAICDQVISIKLYG